MQEWERKQKHYDAIRSLGPADGIHKDNTGFLYLYEGAKVLAALEKLGHSSLGYETCKCRKET